MSLDPLIQRLSSGNPPVTNAEAFAAQCAAALRQHRRSDYIFLGICGTLVVAGILVGTLNPDAAKSAGWLALLSGGYLGRRLMTRHRLRSLLVTHHPDAAANAGVKVDPRSADSDVPRYAREK